MKKTALRESLIFLLFAFTIPLICILLMKYVSVFNSGILNFILFGIEAAAPTISAVITVIILGNKLKSFLYNKYINNFSLPLTLVAFMVPLAVYFLSKVVSQIFVGGNLIGIITQKKIIIILWALIAEELGWRGFLEERLDKLCKVYLTPVVLGLIWALWHYHYFISGSMNVPVILFVLGCVFESCGYYAFTKLSKENVVPASVMHFSGNLFINLFLINPDVNGGSIVPYLTYAIFAFINVIIFALYIYKTKTKKAFSRK